LRNEFAPKATDFSVLSSRVTSFLPKTLRVGCKQFDKRKVGMFDAFGIRDAKLEQHRYGSYPRDNFRDGGKIAVDFAKGTTTTRKFSEEANQPEN
jgi:hypothetical protein